MSEGLDATTGEAEVTPVAQTPGTELPATEIPGQVATDSSGIVETPAAQATTKDSLPGNAPLPPNWDELSDVHKSAHKDMAAWSQTMMNGVAEKYKGELAAVQGDADMFRQLCADPNLAKQFADARGVPSTAPAATGQTVPATVQPDIPDNLYDMNKEQLLSVVQTAVTNAQTGSQKELEGIKQQLQNQLVKDEFATLKAKFPDAEQYVSAMSPYYQQGYPLEHAYIVAKATTPASNLPAVQVSATPPPDQTSVASGSTTAIEESDVEAFSGLSSYEIAEKKRSTDPEIAKAMAILDEK